MEHHFVFFFKSCSYYTYKEHETRRAKTALSQDPSENEGPVKIDCTEFSTECVKLYLDIGKCHIQILTPMTHRL